MLIVLLIVYKEIHNGEAHTKPNNAADINKALIITSAMHFQRSVSEWAWQRCVPDVPLRFLSVRLLFSELLTQCSAWFVLIWCSNMSDSTCSHSLVIHHPKLSSPEPRSAAITMPFPRAVDVASTYVFVYVKQAPIQIPIVSWNALRNKIEDMQGSLHGRVRYGEGPAATFC
jgi:hypothetical protein